MTDFAQLGMDVDTSGLIKGRTELQNLEARGAKTEAAMTKSAAIISKGWSKMAAGIGISLAAVFSSGAIIRGISEFESSMSKVAAISGATNKDLDLLRKTAQELGRTTEFSAGQAADALGFLSMAGFEASESMAAIPAVLDLATSSGMDLASAADIASNILSGFGVSADQAGRAADVLAEAASSSNTNVIQLGSAMSTVAPISAALGVSMEETAAAIGVMSDAGIQGERAGTALRGIMSSLAGPTKAATDSLAKYGLTAADINPETQSLTEIMETLAERGLTTADAMTIFGREAASGALVMVGATNSMGKLTQQFQAADGAASAMATTMRDNLGGDISGMKSALEGLILSLGEAGLTSAIRLVVHGITELVRGVTSAVEWFSTVQGYIIAGATALAISYTPAMMAAATATWGLVTANAAYITSLVTLKGALIATGIGALVVLAGSLVNQFLKLAEATGGVGKAFSAMGVVLGLTLSGGVQALLAFEQYFNSWSESLKAIWLKFMLVMRNAWVDFLQMMSSALQHLPQMESAFNAVSGAAIEAEARATALEVSIGMAEAAAASFGTNARSMLASAFDPALAKAAQLIAMVRNVALSDTTSTGPDDGSRGGQLPNTPIINIPSMPSFSPISVGSGGGGGAGVSGMTAEQGMSALDHLLNGVTDQTPTEKVEAWHAEVMTALAEANLLERGLLQEHADYKLEIEKSYQDQLAEIQANEHSARLQELGGFFGSMADIAETGGAKMAKIAATFSGAQTMIAAYEAAMKAAAEAKTIAGRIAAYALFVAKGVATVQAIKAAGDNPSSVTGSIASTENAAVESEPQSRQVVEYRIEGTNVRGLETLFEDINEGLRSGHQLQIDYRG